MTASLHAFSLGTTPISLTCREVPARWRSTKSNKLLQSGRRKHALKTCPLNKPLQTGSSTKDGSPHLTVKPGTARRAASAYKVRGPDSRLPWLTDAHSLTHHSCTRTSYAKLGGQHSFNHGRRRPGSMLYSQNTLHITKHAPSKQDNMPRTAHINSRS